MRVGGRDLFSRSLGRATEVLKGEGVLMGPLFFLILCALVFCFVSSKAFANTERSCSDVLEGRLAKRRPQSVARVRVQPMSVKTASNGQTMEEPIDAPALCSGFSIRTSQVYDSRSRDQFVTAGHCLPESLQREFQDLGTAPDRMYFVVDDGFIAVPEREQSVQEGYVTEIQPSRLSGVAGVDIGFFELRGRELPTTQALSLAKRSPRFGDKVYAIGYPGGYGPVRFECRYVGVGLRTNGGWDAMVALDELDCPDISKRSDDIGGMSGGAVVDKHNEVVGVIVQQIQGATGQVQEGSSTNMSRIGMVPLTQRNFRDARTGYRPTRFTGQFESKYLDWTTGQVVKLSYGLHQGTLQGPSVIRDTRGRVLEQWDFKDGFWM